MASALRTFADNPNLTAAGSAEHGYALRDFLILLRSADVIPAHLDTMTRVLNAYSSANYAPYRDMREAVNYVFNLTYYLLNVPANHAGVAADDHDFRLALRDFVTRNFSADYGNGTTEYLIVNSAFELGRYLDIDTPPAFLTQTRTLVKSLTDQYSLSHGRNVFLKLAEMINYFDRNNCAWYGASVCTAMQDLQDEILPPSQTRVCHDGKLRIRNHDLTATQLDYICESLAQQKAAFFTLMGTSEAQPVANDYNATLEVVIFKNQSHYTSYSTTFFNNSTNNGGIYLEGTPSSPTNVPRFITFIAPSSWTRPSGIWEPWNLHHEYTHYLDGRYNFHGGFSALPGTAPYSAVWFTEGVGEYMAQFFLSNLPTPSPTVEDIAVKMAASFLTRNDQNVWYVGTQPSLNVPLSTVFDNQYGVSPQDNIYTWGYLATRFMFERYRSDIDALLAVARVGNYAPGYRTWLDNVRSGKDQEFRTWLDCYLLNDADTTSCNTDVGQRIFNDDFEGDPPPEPVNIPVNLPVCASDATLTNGCKIPNLTASGTNVKWISILPPANAKTLWIKTRNGVGDVDVYVAKTPTWPYPTTPGADSSTSEGNTEAVRIENPGNVWHNIGLHAKNGDYFSGVDIYAYWLLDGQEDIDPSLVDPEEPEEPGENPDPIPDVSHLPECANDYALSSDCKITNLGASGSGFKTFHFQVLARALPVKVTIRSFGGTGDADLFYKLPGDGYPNPTTFDQSSTFAGNNETIAVTAPLAGYHNLALYPKAGGSFEGVTVAVFFEEDEPEEPEPGFDPNTLPECASTYILTAGCKISGQTRTGNGRAYLTFQIPANTPRAVVKTFGGTGDVDMFGKFSPDYPTPENHEHASTNVGNDETITLDDPTAGLWYNVTLQAKSTGFSDVGVYLTFPAEDPEEPEPIDPSTLPECTASDARQLDPGCKRSGAEQANATWFTWFMTYVPAGANSLTIKTFGGTGDAGDAGVWPNATTYAHLSDNAGNEESVTITTPASGWYYIGLRPKSASFSGVSIYITRD